MRIVVGLGNPGKQHAQDRHNLGFMVVERLAGALQAGPWKTQCQAQTARVQLGGEGHLLVLPQTFMNLSGQAVACLLRFYKLPAESCLVISDDLDLPVGALRQRSQGSDGGHKGLRSIIQHCGSSCFKRLRIGIGRPAHKGTVNSFVLGFHPSEAAALAQGLSLAARQADTFLRSGVFENWSAAPQAEGPQDTAARER